MLKNLTYKIKSLLKINDRENIKDVLEDLIEDNTNGQDKIDDGTKNIFKNVINLNNKCIEDVMIPRADIDAVSVETTYNDLVSFVDKTKHSRIPVFDGLNLCLTVGFSIPRKCYDLPPSLLSNEKLGKNNQI